MNKLSEGLRLKSIWTIDRYRGIDARIQQELSKGRPVPFKPKSYRTTRVVGNLGLNEGITELLNLICGISGTAWSNAAAYLGVGDDATAAGAAQTGLQAVTNKLYRAMDAGYPSVTGQVASWRSTFVNADAVWDWHEYSLSNTNSNTGKNLNRKVQDEGTKPNDETWVPTLAITVA